MVLESLKTRKRDEIIKVKNNQAGNRTEDELYASTKRRKINFFQNP